MELERHSRLERKAGDAQQTKRRISYYKYSRERKQHNLGEVNLFINMDLRSSTISQEGQKRPT